MDLARLLAVPMYRAFDIDAEGRVLAGSDASGSVQLTEIQPNGDMVPLTALPGARWGRYLHGPGERAIIVVHDEGGNERYQLSLLRLPRDGGPATLGDLEPVVRDPRFIHSLSDVRPGKISYLTNRRNGVDFDPVIRDLATGAEQTVNVGDWLIHEATLSPDGRWLAVNVALPTVAYSTQILLVDLTAPEGEHITEVSPAGDLAVNNRPRWLPSSGALVFSSNTGREFTGLARYNLATGERTWLVTDDSADLLGWLSPDGSKIFVERNDDGASQISVHDAETGERLRDMPLPVTGSVVDVRWPDPRWSPDSRTLALSISSAAMPNDVLSADAGTGAVRQLTHSARAWGGEHPAVAEQHKVPAEDGELVPCLVYRPAQDTDPALAGSAVLVIHGGPEAQSKQDYNPYIQAMASAGHTIVVPNVRGSTGYGKRWYSADDGPRRLSAVADLTAIHAYLPGLGIDPARAALWGGSYGGYMVLAGLAFQPELWAAGVDIVGISSLVTFLENTSPYRRAYREREYGSLARDREFLHAASPLTRIDQIRAPLFIIHGANDPRVPLSEAEQIHAALTAHGQECELLVYGDEGHGLAKRSNREDAVPKAIAFLARHLAS
ncbi:MAG TPA: prolyl oligopeptidase family serine peptidase [Streptosporangiaceae bacterium]